MDRKLIDYLPTVVRDVRDYEVLMDSEQESVEEAWDNISNLLNDIFTESASENGIERREQIFSIKPKATDTLGERRFRIQVKENEQLPYSYRVLEKQLSSLCGDDGFSLNVSDSDYLVKIKLELKAKKNIDEVRIYARKIAPANIAIDISIMYNQYSKVGKLTYKQLSSRSYRDIRNEVLI